MPIATGRPDAQDIKEAEEFGVKTKEKLEEIHIENYNLKIKSMEHKIVENLSQMFLQSKKK